MKVLVILELAHIWTWRISKLPLLLQTLSFLYALEYGASHAQHQSYELSMSVSLASNNSNYFHNIRVKDAQHF